MPEQPRQNAADRQAASKALQMDRQVALLERALQQGDLIGAGAVCSKLTANLAGAEASELVRASQSIDRLLVSARDLRRELKAQLKGTLEKRQGISAYQRAGA